MYPPTTNRVKGIYVAFTPGMGLDLMRIAIVEATSNGTLIVRGESDGTLRMILSAMNEADVDAIINGVAPQREIA